MRNVRNHPKQNLAIGGPPKNEMSHVWPWPMAQKLTPNAATMANLHTPAVLQPPVSPLQAKALSNKCVPHLVKRVRHDQ